MPQEGIMDALSIICIVGGCLTIITRGPLVFAPITTLRTYDRWFLSTNARMRVFGVVVAALATGLLLLPLGEEVTRLTESIINTVGWFIVAIALVMFSVPNIARHFVRVILEYFEHSVPSAIIRVLGLLAVAIGVVLIYVGVYIV